MRRPRLRNRVLCRRCLRPVGRGCTGPCLDCWVDIETRAMAMLADGLSYGDCAVRLEVNAGTLEQRIGKRRRRELAKSK